MKTVELPEFKEYRQLKNMLLSIIGYQEGKILLWEGLWDDKHEQLYRSSINLSNEIIKILEKIITRETKFQLPSIIDDDVEFVL